MSASRRTKETVSRESEGRGGTWRGRRAAARARREGRRGGHGCSRHSPGAGWLRGLPATRPGPSGQPTSARRARLVSGTRSRQPLLRGCAPARAGLLGIVVFTARRAPTGAGTKGRGANVRRDRPAGPFHRFVLERWPYKSGRRGSFLEQRF